MKKETLRIESNVQYHKSFIGLLKKISHRCNYRVSNKIWQNNYQRVFTITTNRSIAKTMYQLYSVKIESQFFLTNNKRKRGLNLK